MNILPQTFSDAKVKKPQFILAYIMVNFVDTYNREDQN